jgi:hypothetical protein
MFSLLRLPLLICIKTKMPLLICTKTKMPLLICTKTKNIMAYSVLKKWTCLATDLVVAVDPDCAGLHLLAELQGLPDVARYDSFREIKGWQTSRLPSWMGRIGDWKGQCHEILPSGFFPWTSFPQPLSIPLGRFQIFPKIRKDILSSRCTTGVVDTGGKWKKS